ncbi:hypothetical protein DFH06DRAFT_1172366 [Mycena polygramma]|nr:hypothetical protein DFH06DRAFT_1172366 [Mycena polygramma]
MSGHYYGIDILEPLRWKSGDLSFAFTGYVLTGYRRLLLTGVYANIRSSWMPGLSMVLRPWAGPDASMATLYSILLCGYLFFAPFKRLLCQNRSPALIMPPFHRDLHIASETINYFTSPQLPRHQNLSKYHKHQTRFLSKTCSKIEKRIMKCIESDEFLNHTKDMMRDINHLERTLQGGSLAVWFLFPESQEEFSRIQRTLARYATSDWKDSDPDSNSTLNDQFYQRVDDARKKDNAELQAKIGDLVKTFQNFQSGKRRMFRRSPDPEHCLNKLFPSLGVEGGQIAHPPMLVYKSMLDKFTRNPPYPTLSTLVTVLTSYLVTKINDMTPEQREPGGVRPFELQVIRKTSGSIITILLGPNTRNKIQSIYYPCKDLLKLPVLYTATAHNLHNLSQDGFVVAWQAIQARPDSRKYIVWNGGAAPSTDIYLVEPPAPEAFILATFLGDNLTSDVVRPFLRNSRHIKDALCENEAPWIAHDGWVAYGMHGLQCDARELRPYHHQIFVPGPPPRV